MLTSGTDVGAPEPLDLPTDRPRRNTASSATVSATVGGVRPDPALTEAILSAWLLRITGQDDVWFVLDGEGRRVDVSGDPSFSELRTRGTAVPAPDGVQVLARTDSGPSQVGDAELVIGMGEDGVTVTGRADLFDEPSVTRFARQLAMIAAQAAADDTVAVGACALMDAEEREHIALAYNQTARPFSERARVQELVAAQAAATPTQVAVVDERGSLSYTELDAAANRLAAHLIAAGVAPGGRVGIHLGRSASIVVAALAVWRAGAAYVPLDPTFPADRLAYMAQDSGLSLLITERALAGRLSLPAGVLTVEIDRDHEAIAAHPATDPAISGDSRDAAYVIYTSGSTGRPKGVVIEHRSLVNFLETMAQEPGFGPDDVLLAVTTLSFDIAGLELFLPLLRGGRVVVVGRDTTTDPAALLSAISRHEATVMQATPATWRMLVDGGWAPGSTPGLRSFCGGEALPMTLAQQLVERSGEVWNLYGPTETTIWSAVERIRADEPITIGHPIANTTLHVLGPRSELVPIGVPGELCIGGDGLARGYHERPELTGERFAAGPFTDVADDRLYRTGDLVRRRADGRIEYLGRLDNQVKIRGFRIELGEIEAALARHPAVEEAVVTAAEDPAGQKRLVAYVTVSRADVPRSELRRHTGDFLPQYMVPSVIMVLDAFPRTPNGKTDRKSLPVPDWHAAERDVPFRAPRDDLERRLVATWEQTLGISPIGMDDDLFTLGVDSLTTARLVGRVAEAFDVPLAVGTLFGAPTPATLAEHLRRGPSEPRWPSLVEINPGPAEPSAPPLFCVHGGAGTILLYAQLARLLADERAVFGLQAQGLYGRDPIHTSVADMAAAYLEQIREVQPHGPYSLVGYCYGGHVAHELGVRLRDAGEEVTFVGYINAPSIAYIRRHKPHFDEDGARTGAGGELLKAEEAATPARLTPRAVPRRARAIAARRLRRWQFSMALRLERPLPEALRERRWFQLVAHRAERAYAPPRLDARAVVWRAEGLYFEDDLGWQPHTALVDAVEIRGEQRIPRDTMNEPFVREIAASIRNARD